MSLDILSEAAARGPAALSVAEQDVSADGVADVFWPLPMTELLATRDRLLERLLAWFRARDIDRDRNAELLWLNAWPITMEFLRLYSAVVVVARLGPDGIAPARDDRGATLFDCVSSGAAPGPSQELRNTLRGLVADPLWKKLARQVRALAGRDALPYRIRPLIDPARDIVTFSATPLIAARARQSGAPVVLSKIDEWMSTGPLDDAPRTAGASDGAIGEVLDLLAEACAEGGAALPDHIRHHARDQLVRLTRRCGVHLEELRRREHRLPRVFWSGSCGIVYNRVMARAVIRAGGRAVGHDHSTGTGWWRFPLRTVNEFNYVEQFVTTGEAMAEGLRRSNQPAFRVGPEQGCEIVPLVAGRPEVADAEVAPLPSRPASLDVMYVFNLYAGDSVQPAPSLADPVAVDLQARVIGRLRAQGHRVTLKPHPDSYCDPPAAFFDRLGATRTDKPCESVMPDADLLIFDFVGASCLLGALRTDRPIVLIDLPMIEIAPEALELLERRVAILPAGFDREGRVAIDWPAFDAAIERAWSLRDDRFLTTYYPPLPDATS